MSNRGFDNQVYSNTNGHSYYGSLSKERDKVTLGEGAQRVDAGGGRDFIYAFSDDGEPDPAQTNGAEGRYDPPVPDGLADDILKGGQGKDTFAFRLLLDAQDEILEKHTRDDGTVNWRKVAGENGDVHLHWVAGIGNDTILDYSKQDGDKIDIRGHTVEIASIKYGEDAGGDYSLITLRSQQGKGGGAHDEDPLGTVKVYGDKVTKKDITLKAKVFYGIDQLEEIAEGEAASPANNTPPDTTPIQWGPDNPETINLEFIGSDRWDKFYAGSGSQTIYGNGGRDKFISMADQGEPDPAQTNGAEGRVYDPLPPGTGDDVFYGGAGADEFRFHALLNATPEVLGQHTREDGKVNWRKVAGENDDVHGHWVEGIGNETIGDFSKSDGDKIVVRGHTVEIASVTHGSDAGGAYSLITVRSQQGNGGAGGANTETGAHDEDPLGTIKVYGDKVFKRDIKVEAKNVFDGMEKLQQADALADFNGGVQQFGTSENGASVASAPETLKTRDIIEIGSGAQTVNAGAGHDRITVYADAGEPDPAQTEGAVGRVDPPIDPALTKDIVSGGTGRDVFTFNMLLDATDVVLARYTQSDGSIKWRKVAGENEKVHDHWVAGGGDDELHDFSKEEKDQIILRGHTVEIADIDYGSDAKGSYSLITMRSQQGDNGGAHDEDPLGTLKVYGDKVTRNDIKVKAKVFDGVDEFEPMDAIGNPIFGDDGANTLAGTGGIDNMHGAKGNDLMQAAGGNDYVFGEGGHDTLEGAAGDDWLEGGSSNDMMDGGLGNDTLVASRGKDELTGGADADVFLFKDTIRKATITDFEDGIDLIDLSRMEAARNMDDIEVEQVAANEYTLFFGNDAGKETVVQVLSASNVALDQNDFLF